MYMYSECSMAPNSVHMDSNERKPKTCSETFVETLPFVRLSSSLPAVSGEMLSMVKSNADTTPTFT
jgi:hypothetical protein